MYKFPLYKFHKLFHNDYVIDILRRGPEKNVKILDECECVQSFNYISLSFDIFTSFII